LPEFRSNFSSRLLLRPGLEQVVRGVLDETAIAAPQLLLEFSESDILDQELPRAHLKALAAMGVGIALDDIGTGNISLANLNTLKLDQLKIDCSRLGLVGDGSSTDMTQLIVSVSRFLGLETVAKKLETQVQVDWARRTGIALGQGYQLCAPMPADGLADLLASSPDSLRMSTE
jgi:diguanylate cyclase